MHQSPISTELALRTFEADAAFSAALAGFQLQASGLQNQELLKQANNAGFSWLLRPGDHDNCYEVVLRHAAGSEERAYGSNPEDLILGLLGAIACPQAPRPAEAEIMQKTHKPSLTSDFQPAAEAPQPFAEAAAKALAVATGGTVIESPPEEEPPGPDPNRLLSDEEKAAATAMVKAMTPTQRKAFTIAFRSAFNVPRAEPAIAPLITLFCHLDFIDRFTGEAAGVPKP